VREQEQAESSNHAGGATKQDSFSSDEDDKYDSEEEDAAAAGANLLKKSKLHDDEYLEKKMSKIQANLMKSSIMNAKMNDSKIAKIENEIMQKVRAQE
jgi:hypothetical protein